MRLARTVALVFALAVVLPMALVVFGSDEMALAVFIVMPFIAVLSAIVLVWAAVRGKPIPLLSYMAVTLSILALGSLPLGILALMTVLGGDIDEATLDIIIYSVILAVTGVPGPVFLLLYFHGYFDTEDTDVVQLPK